MKPMIPDDGLRNTARLHGTNKHYPCGHPRTPENTRVMTARAPVCCLCRRRIDRESWKRRKGTAA